MTDAPQPTPQSWFEKLSHALLREPSTREELINLLRDAESRELISQDTLGMIEGVLQVTQMQVRDIMIPRPQMVVVDVNTPPEQYLPVIIESKHSRFPAIDDDRDDVIGILLAKDLLGIDLNDPKSGFNLTDILRPATFIPESKRLDRLLKEFRLTHNHMAIVADEYGGVAGLVTIEDVLEQIVGDIEDEHDIDEEDFIKQHKNGVYIVKALTTIEDFMMYFDCEIEDKGFDTIGGVVVQAFGHLPKRGEAITIEPFSFTVLHADNRRIRLLQVTRTQD